MSETEHPTADPESPKLSALDQLILQANQRLATSSAGSVSARDRFRTLPGDVIISTPMKSGTAWLQQICHQLRSGGHDDFDDIDMVLPRIPSRSLDSPVDLDAPQMWTPRMFVSHDPWDIVHKPAKYICCIREPTDTCFSAYHFINNIYGVPHEKWDPVSFWHNYYSKDPKSFYAFILSWWPRRNDDDVLWLHFEDLKKDLRFCVREVARFLGTPLTETLENLVCERATFQYMSEHKTQFDSHNLHKMRLLGMGVTVGEVNIGRTRRGGGQIGQGKERLPPEVIDEIDRKWREEVMPMTGYADYSSMLAKESILSIKGSKTSA